ncbi:unnamed protein product [Adineta steineri]|uniref:Uncharacterized protein n=1 Tax=Adineta steineri TaxID=433720 RepID=A0A815IZR0_9BILA|nr:unnamed protein product [Adineta steineri]
MFMQITIKFIVKLLEKNRTLTKKERKGDMNTNDKQNLKLLLTVTQTKNSKINNTRSDDYFEEREIYEKLCRQNGTQLIYFKIVFLEFNFI